MEPLQNDKKALGEISSLNLAYIGDGVYELMVRERLLRQGGRVRDLHTLAVEQVRAGAGLDIGGTLIGMHLRPVAVPVRLSLSRIGEAGLLCARTRPKYIGGSRAAYLPGSGR